MSVSVATSIEALAESIAELRRSGPPLDADDVERLTPVVVAILADLDELREEMLEFREQLLVTARTARPRVTLSRFAELCGRSRPSVQKWIYAAQEKYPGAGW